MMPRDILELAANENGDDFIMGDVHGNFESFEQVLQYVKAQLGARFFVAGDMPDRGTNSLAVIKAVQDNPGVVFAVRGNHEEMVLDSIQALEDVLLTMAGDGVKIKDPLELATRGKANDELSLHIKENDGMWLFRLFAQELMDDKITIKNGVIEYTNDCEIKKVKDILSALPYIICVRGGGTPDKTKVRFHSAFNVVHADMPFDDTVLRERLKTGQGLTREEKKYSTWARDHGNTLFKKNGRNKYSAITYCGHNIVFNEGTSSVRQNTNTVDLDAGTYYSNIALLVNHTQKTVTPLTVQPASRERKLKRVLQSINDHLTSEQKRENLLLNLSVVRENIKEVHQFLADSKNHEKYYDYIEYLLNNDGLSRFGVKSRREFDEKIMECMLNEVRLLTSPAKAEAFLLAITDTWPEEMLGYGELLEYILKNDGLRHLQIVTVDDYFAKLNEKKLSLNGLSFFSEWKKIHMEIVEEAPELQQKHGS